MGEDKLDFKSTRVETQAELIEAEVWWEMDDAGKKGCSRE